MDEELQQESINQQDIELREHQARCIHPSYKCSLCGLYKDNLINEYKETIKNLLEDKVSILEEKEVRYIIYLTSF